MIPKPEEVFLESLKLNKDKFACPLSIQNAMREYGRRLLDHVAEQAINYNNFEVVDKEEILKIKDEL